MDLSFAKLAGIVIEEERQELEQILLEAVKSSDALVTEVGTHLIRSGGKRLRPALFLLAAHAGGKKDHERAMRLAAALELIHTASLVHDDVIDRAATRRGAPTANAKWDNKIAILSGDFIFARAFGLVVNHGFDDYTAGKLAGLVEDLSIGEIAQDKAMYQVPSEAEYYAHIQKKTADFLEVCCELGAYIGGMKEEETAQMAFFGHSVGMAFQITDDLLDVQQDEKKIGKPAGNDIRQGVITLPVIRALAVSPEAEALRAIVTNASMTDEMVARAISLVKATDAISYAKAKADAYLSRAESSLPESLPKKYQQAFRRITEFIGKRDF